MDWDSIALFFKILLFLVLGLAVVIGIYVLVTRNDLARRWQRLLALAADTRAVRQRRQGVGGDIRQHIGGAQRNEQRIAGHGSRRGGRGGGARGVLAVGIRDTANGWPTPLTAGLSGQGMITDVSSRDQETAARLRLQSEAATYNEKIAQWPTSAVAAAFGFRPWRFPKNQPRRGWRH